MSSMISATKDEDPSTHLAFDRTWLASERTLFALIRTGFVIAGGGTLITALLGNAWPKWLTAIPAAIFVTIGFTIIIVGLNRYRHMARKYHIDEEMNPIPTRLMVLLAIIMQVTLIAVMVFYLLEFE